MEKTLDQALADAQARLMAVGAPQTEARFDARVLLAAIVQRNRAYLMAHGDEPLPAAELQTYNDWVERRATGEPVAYLLQRREFWSLDLAVTTATLIPRPDTETLVAAALERWPASSSARVLDLGTGSGAIALALASEHPNATVVATDLSEAALQVARGNATRLELGNVEWRQGSWFEAIGADEKFDLIVSNPPYIDPADRHLKQGDVAHEPRSALIASDHGYADLAHIIESAATFMHENAWLLVEHGKDQAARVRAEFTAAGFGGVQSLGDLAGHPRVTLGQRL